MNLFYAALRQQHAASYHHRGSGEEVCIQHRGQAEEGKEADNIGNGGQHHGPGQGRIDAETFHGDR